MKRKNKIRKQSKEPIAKLQRKLWELCKQIIRNKYGNECYTCDAKNLSGPNWHTGHFLPKGACGASLKYDLRNLRPQCYRCNIHHGGNGAQFMANMIIREGQPYVDAIFAKRNFIIKAREHYEYLLVSYTQILEDINA